FLVQLPQKTEAFGAMRGGGQGLEEGRKRACLTMCVGEQGIDRDPKARLTDGEFARSLEGSDRLGKLIPLHLCLTEIPKGRGFGAGLPARRLCDALKLRDGFGRFSSPQELPA